ncbi:type IV pilus biogenesis protein PilM [Fredinandcohnia quinoae]|uniref:Pilus assembly protein PilM n=1 Tax=Fredinandcohnia quinoae TaxID=2918902 RepID=A0AAW5E6P2_9BACI|nr:pilus assembly protein PilM [Fredinandcohnia sp. SECRCQ15]MCH1626569.1 pilus assembly protein PilM [Fredinandcohnia sp. SECRCQ15]
MAFTLLHSNQIANIVIKDHVIRYVGAKQTNPLTIRNFRERYLPKGIIHEGKIIGRDTLQLILEECVTDWGIKKKEVRFVIPDSFVVIRKTSIPIEIKDDEILGYLYLELGGSIHLPFDEPVIDFIKLGEEDNKKVVLMFAAPQEIAQDYATLLEEVALRPIAADISPLCMYRLFYFYEKVDAVDHTMLLQFDLQTVNLSIFNQHLPVFMRHLPIDSTIDDWDIRQNPENTSAEIQWVNPNQAIEMIIDEIMKEIEHVLNFYRFNIRQGNEQVTNILMSGDHPYLHVLMSTLFERFEIPVQILETQVELPVQYYLPLGLALKEVQ